MRTTVNLDDDVAMLLKQRVQGSGQSLKEMANRVLLTGLLGGDLVSEAHLAALAFENGGTVYSQDADFARFNGVRWTNPLVG